MPENTLNPVIRQAGPDDAATVLSLITALAEFEQLRGPDGDALSRFLEYGFGPNPRFEAWLVELPEEGNKAVGYAVLYNTFSTFLVRPGLYLEDIFVLPEYRSQGYGKMLLRHAVQLALDRGCGRLEWTCLDWNVDAQAVYKSMGARQMKEWILYRMTAGAQADFLNSGS